MFLYLSFDYDDIFASYCVHARESFGLTNFEEYVTW